jgi:hypothetical protein
MKRNFKNSVSKKFMSKKYYEPDFLYLILLFSYCMDGFGRRRGSV